VLRAWHRLVAPTGRWPRLVIAAACALILVLYCSNPSTEDPDHPPGDGRYHPVLARGDGHMSYLMARSTALDGDWVFDNDLARFGDPWNAPRTKTGRKSIIHPIGPPLVWTPMIWLAEGGAVVANAVGADIPLHGYTTWHQRIVFLSSALFACGAVLLGRRLAHKLLPGGGGPWAPTYAAVAVLLGTSLTYYATDMPSYAHAMDAFACAAFLCYWAETAGRRDVRRWLALGALLGIATLVRVQELAMGIVVAIEVVTHAIRHARAKQWPDAARWLGGGALALGATLVVFIPQLVEWQLVFGTVTELPQGAKYTRLEAPMFVELLFSVRNGWFTTTPIAYAAVIGLGVLVGSKRTRSLVVIGLVAAVAIQVYLNSTILDWWGGSAYGQRRLCNVTLPLVVGLAALFAACARARLPRLVRHAIALVVFGVFIGWNLHRVIALRGGKSAPSELVPICCDWVVRPLRGPATAVYHAIGDPFAFPANAVFAARHGVSMQRWDAVVGDYPFIPALDALLDERLWREHGKAGLGPSYVVSGFGPSLKADRAFRWTTAPTATLLVPNLMPYGQRITAWLAPGGAQHATLRWNGEQVADVDLKPGWNAVAFELPHPALHTNELAIDATPAMITVQPPAPWPSPTGPVGVAVGALDLVFLPPAASALGSP
jgi:hypothetical protein